MSVDLILFFVLALIAVASALGMLLSRNTVYSALYLVLNFVTVAVFFLLLGAPFVAMAQVTVYAGAIMVLFLFVIMLLGTESLPPGTALRKIWIPASVLGVALIAELVMLLYRAAGTQQAVQPAAEVNSIETLRQMSLELFGSYLLPFEITSVLLLVAMVGAIVLTKKEKGGMG